MGGCCSCAPTWAVVVAGRVPHKVDRVTDDRQVVLVAVPAVTEKICHNAICTFLQYLLCFYCLF